MVADTATFDCYERHRSVAVTDLKFCDWSPSPRCEALLRLKDRHVGVKIAEEMSKNPVQIPSGP
jgi:hypothetical protein